MTAVAADTAEVILPLPVTEFIRDLDRIGTVVCEQFLKLGGSRRSCLVSCGIDSGCSPYSYGGPPLGPIHRQVSGGRCCRRSAAPGCPQGLVSSPQISDRSSTRRTTASPQPAWRTQAVPAAHSDSIRFPQSSRLVLQTFGFPVCRWPVCRFRSTGWERTRSPTEART